MYATSANTNTDSSMHYADIFFIAFFIMFYIYFNASRSDYTLFSFILFLRCETMFFYIAL